MGVNKSTGEWKLEKDYSKFPKKKWCDYDFVADWLMRQGYKPKTSYTELIDNIIDNYREDRTVEEKGYFAIEDKRKRPDNLMINIADVAEFVKASGGIEKFDFSID